MAADGSRQQDRASATAQLFASLDVGGLTLPNRVAVAPRHWPGERLS